MLGAVLGLGSVSASAAGTAGSLDPTFGHNGVVLTNLGRDAGGSPINAVPSDATLLANGDIVVAGQFGLVRYLPSGNLDTAFGAAGVAQLPAGASGLFPPGLAVQSDGKYLWAGAGTTPSGSSGFAAIRFNANGSLDQSFGHGGQVLSTAAIGNITALGLDASGDIFALPAHAEFSPAGQPDATVTPAAITTSSHGGPDTFLPSGQYVLGSSVGVAKHDVDIQVERFNANGSRAAASTAFDFSGATGLDQARDSAGAVAVQPNGQTVVGGSHFLGTSPIGMGRVNADGSLDTTFGNGGTLTTTLQGNEGASAVLIQPDGKIIAVSMSENNSTGVTDLALVRYLS